MGNASPLRITSKQLKIAFPLLAAISLAVWLGFVVYAERHPLPAGTCVSAYSDCAGGPTMWGNVVWGSMGFFVVLIPGWVVTIVAIVAAHYISRHRGEKRGRQ